VKKLFTGMDVDKNIVLFIQGVTPPQDFVSIQQLYPPRKVEFITKYFLEISRFALLQLTICL